MEIVIKFVADGLLVIIAACGAVLLLRGVPRRRIIVDYSYAVMAGMTALLIGKLMSFLYQPTVARPFLELGVNPGALYIDNPGFPSDHALLAWVIVLAVYFLTPYRKFSYMLALLAAVMSIGRVAALVHTPLDIFGGFLAAAVGGLWYIARRHNERR